MASAFPFCNRAANVISAEDLGTEMIILYVGPNCKQYIVHKKLITSQSQYFSSMFDGKSEEAEEKSAHLKEDDPAAVGLLVGWLYRGAIPTVDKTPDILVKNDFLVSTADFSLPPGGTIYPFKPFLEKEQNSVSDLTNSFQDIGFQSMYMKFSREELRMADYMLDRKYGAAAPGSVATDSIYGNQALQGGVVDGQARSPSNLFGAPTPALPIPSGSFQLGSNAPMTTTNLFEASVGGLSGSQSGQSTTPTNTTVLFSNQPVASGGLFDGLKVATPTPEDKAVSPSLRSVGGSVFSNFPSLSEAGAPSQTSQQSHQGESLISKPTFNGSNDSGPVPQQVTTPNRSIFGAPAATFFAPNNAANVSGSGAFSPNSSAVSFHRPFGSIAAITGSPAKLATSQTTAAKETPTIVISPESAHQLAVLHLALFAEAKCWTKLFNAAVDAYIRGEFSMSRQIPAEHAALIYSRTRDGSTLRKFVIDNVTSVQGFVELEAYKKLAKENDAFLEGLLKKSEGGPAVMLFDGSAYRVSFLTNN